MRCERCGREMEELRMPDFRGQGEMVVGYCCPCQADEAEEERRAEERRRAEDEAEGFRRRQVASGIGRRFVDATHPRAGELAAKVAGGRSLYVCGPVGCGKTHLASAVAIELLRMGRKVRFETSLDVMAHAFEDSERWAWMDVYVLDDLGQEAATSHALQTLWKVVNERDRNALPIITTTQLQPGELARHLGEGGTIQAEAIVSRLTHDAEVVMLAGGDRRAPGLAS